MGIKNWLIQVALKKGLKRIIGVIVAGLASSALVSKAGVTIDESQLTIGLVGVLEVIKNYLHHKVGVKWL